MWWHRLNLQQRIFVLFILPMVLLAYLCTVRIVTRAESMSQAESVIALARMTQSMAGLMEPLTAERSQANQFVIAKGQISTAPWFEMKPKVDAAAARLNERIAATNRGSFG